jgi:hypothetical protein
MSQFAYHRRFTRNFLMVASFALAGCNVSKAPIHPFLQITAVPPWRQALFSTMIDRIELTPG